MKPTECRAFLAQRCGGGVFGGEIAERRDGELKTCWTKAAPQKLGLLVFNRGSILEASASHLHIQTESLFSPSLASRHFCNTSI
jgi:hypothetical protein